MDKNQTLWGDTVSKKIITHLEKRRMAGSYAPTAAQARDEILCKKPYRQSIPKQCSAREIHCFIGKILKKTGACRIAWIDVTLLF